MRQNRIKVVLVGVYHVKRFEKMKKIYSYPLFNTDVKSIEWFNNISELWLFDEKKCQKKYAAEFVGIKSEKNEQSPKKNFEKYALFKITPIDESSKICKRVVVRLNDFSSSAKIQKQLKAYLKCPKENESELEQYLPKIITKIPVEQLYVCEKNFSYDLFSWDQLSPIKPIKGKYTAVELFAGAGGLSIGLENAGINVVLANEIEADFASTLRANHPHTNVINEDIHKIDFRKELRKLGLESVDVLSGGPPCQGFSTIGAKNRQDPRNSLFYEYLRAISETNPKYTIFENVSGFKRMYGGFAYETLVKEMDALGYETKCQILNAADYGAPQIRFRTIVLGWRKGLKPLEFPTATHGNKKGLKPYVTLMDAISDLPYIESGQSSSIYSMPPQTEYQKKLRGKQDVLLEHNASNYGEKMQEILHILPEGGSIKDLPLRLRPKSAYCNTYARLFPNEPSPTITRNFGTPSSSRCVHPFQPRALSTREGARLQGFPDSYRFIGGKQSKNLQIGNAVPTVLGEVIASVIKKALDSEMFE